MKITWGQAGVTVGIQLEARVVRVVRGVRGVKAVDGILKATRTRCGRKFGRGLGLSEIVGETYRL
jgi:hypothetical protein